MDLSKDDESTILAALSHRSDTEVWENSFEAYTHMSKARGKLQEECPDGCFLMAQDTIDIATKDKKFLVLAPPAYDMVTVLDKSHYMFAKKLSYNKECGGIFRALLGDYVPADKFAVKPSAYQVKTCGTHPGVWYKVTPKLVAACQKINDQVASFTCKSLDPDVVKLRKKVRGYKKAILDVQKEKRKFKEDSDSSDVDLPEDASSAKKRKRDKVLYKALGAGEDKLEERIYQLRCEMGECVADIRESAKDNEREYAEDSDGEE